MKGTSRVKLILVLTALLAVSLTIETADGSAIGTAVIAVAVANLMLAIMFFLEGP